MIIFHRQVLKQTFSLFIFMLLWTFNLCAQPAAYTVSNGHAHNDYMHVSPFHAAYDAGFGSIEADIFPQNGELYVAHHKKDIKPERTLNKLYLTPLLQELLKDNKRTVKLLIDIKENYRESLLLLQKEIKPLRKYLYSGKHRKRPVTILISGERPPPGEYKSYPGYIFFDDDLKKPHNKAEWRRVGQVSLSFKRFSNWDGTGCLPESDRKSIEGIVDSVHKAGKTIRFWEAPDNENSWSIQEQSGVDLIGTDRIEEFCGFIEDKRRSDLR